MLDLAIFFAPLLILSLVPLAQAKIIGRLVGRLDGGACGKRIKRSDPQADLLEHNLHILWGDGAFATCVQSI